MVHARRRPGAPESPPMSGRPGWRPDPSPTPRRPTLDGQPATPAVTGLAGFAVLVAVVGSLGLPLPGSGLAIEVWLVTIGFDLARRTDPDTRPMGSDGRWAKRFGLGLVARIGTPTVVAAVLAALYLHAQAPLDEPASRAVLGAVTMTANLFAIYGGAELEAIEHLWLVGLVAQFALVVPVLAAWGHGRIRRDQRASAIVGLAAGVAICRLGFTVAETAAHQSIAVNTLTRLDGLLLGVAIGVAPVDEVRKRVPSGLAAAAFAALLVMFLAAPDRIEHPALTLGLLLPLAAVLAAAIIGSASARSLTGALSAILDQQVLRWLGSRALSIYIWHQIFGFALSLDLVDGANPPGQWPGLALFILRLVFTLAAAATSHRYVELPALAAVDQLQRRHATQRSAAAAGRSSGLGPQTL